MKFDWIEFSYWFLFFIVLSIYFLSELTILQGILFPIMIVTIFSPWSRSE